MSFDTGTRYSKTEFIGTVDHVNFVNASVYTYYEIFTVKCDDGYRFKDDNFNLGWSDSDDDTTYTYTASATLSDDKTEATINGDVKDKVYFQGANLETYTPTTTTSYVLNSYANGKVTQSYSTLTVGSKITYAVAPNSGYEVSTLAIYRFNGPTLPTVDFTKGTKVADLDKTNPVYTIQDADIGNSICIQAVFEVPTVKHFTGTITNNLDGSVDYKEENDAITLTAKTGYTIKSAKLDYQADSSADSQSVGNFTVADDGLTATISLPDSVKGDANIKLIISGEVAPTVKHFTGTITNNLADSVDYKEENDAITLTAKTGYTIKSAKLDYQADSSADSQSVGNFTVADDGLTATISLPDSVKGDANIKLIISGETYTDLEHINPSLTADNATVTIKGNTITIKASAGYIITSAKLKTKDMGDFGNTTTKYYDFTISTDKTVATLVTPDEAISTEKNYYLVITIEQSTTQPSQSTTPEHYTNLKLSTDLKNKGASFTVDDNNLITVTVKSPYIFNKVYLSEILDAGSQVKTSDDFNISSDKLTATLTVPNELLEDGSSSATITGDVADTTPIQPVDSDSHLTQYVYTMDENGLKNFVTTSVNMWSGQTVNYDYTSFINQLYTLPFAISEDLSTPTSVVKTGLWEVKTAARELKSIKYELDLGSIKVTPINNNGFDANIEDIKLYLPFTNPISIDYNDCLNKTISIKYIVNFLTGKTTVNIYSDNTLINTVIVSIVTNLQLFNIYNNKDVGQLSTTLDNGINNAYIIVNYYKPITNLVSYGTLEHNKLSSYTNFVKTKNSTVSCGTQQEQLEIESLLDRGVIINDTTRN